MIYAVDFDGTICEHEFPNIGAPKKDVISFIKKEHANGEKIILWTCRKGVYLEQALLWCLTHDIPLDAVNENLPGLGFDTSNKIYADVYIDDRSINPTSESLG